MKKTIIGLVVAAACALCVSVAEAQITLTWDDTGVLSSSVPTGFDTVGNFSSMVIANPGTGTIDVLLTLSAGYTFTGITTTFTVTGTAGNIVTFSSPTGGPLTLTGGSATASGYSFPDILTSGGTTLNYTVTANTPTAGDLTFSGISVSGTITAVPEPVNYALAGFGLIFVGGGAGRFYLARRRSSTAS